MKLQTATRPPKPPPQGFSDAFRTGDVLDGRYRIERVLGRGGMGVVYQARQLSLDREVAVKVLPPDRAAHETHAARFRRELDVARRLNHPNIVQVYDGGDADGVLFMVMERLEGEDLKQLLQRSGILSLGEVIELVLPVVEAIADAHEQDVVHRDLKPSNIFVCAGPRTRVKVLDFGVGKSLIRRDHDLTQPGHFSGTPAYLAPETILTQTGGKSCDVYAIGLVFAEALFGRRIFEGDDVAQMLVRQLRDEIPVPDPYRGTAVEAFVRATTTRHPEHRLRDGRAVHTALEQLASEMDLSIKATPEDVRRAFARWSSDSGPSEDSTVASLERVGRESTSPAEAVKLAVTMVMRAIPPQKPDARLAWLRALPPRAVASGVGVVAGTLVSMFLTLGLVAMARDTPAPDPPPVASDSEPPRATAPLQDHRTLREPGDSLPKDEELWDEEPLAPVEDWPRVASEPAPPVVIAPKPDPRLEPSEFEFDGDDGVEPVDEPEPEVEPVQEPSPANAPDRDARRPAKRTKPYVPKI